MMDIKILCTLFDITLNSFSARLNSDLQARQDFVLEKAHAIVRRTVIESSTIVMATCIDNHVRDD